MSEILDNALDSLRMGLKHYLDPDLETSDKWAILELFHSIELLLKERLYEEHPLLIYRSVDKPVTDDAQTVGLAEALARFQNLDVELPAEHVTILRDLQRRRNRIEHHRFIPDADHQRVLGKALKFIGYFLEEHLGQNLKDHLPSELFHQAKELMVEYDSLVSSAQSEIETIFSRCLLDPKNYPDLSIGTCPECGNRTVLVGYGDRNKCYFCDEPVIVKLCEYCGEHLPEDDFAGSGICRRCFSNVVAE